MQIAVEEGLPAATEIGRALADRGIDVVSWEAAPIRVGRADDATVVVVTTVQEFEQRWERCDGLVGAGLTPTLGALLADVALASVDEASEVHVTLLLPIRSRRRDEVTSEIVRLLLEAPSVSWWQGRRREDGVAEHRRLAWFPRPMGAQHAAVVGLADVALVRRRHLVPTMTVSVAMRSLQSELVQAAGAGGPFGRWLRRRLSSSRRPPSEERRARDRWAVVVEVVTDEGVVRAWANGTDVVGAHAQVVASVVAADTQVRARSPVDLGAQALLDDLSDRGALRWAVRRPESMPRP